jgi:hypothetical protein
VDNGDPPRRLLLALRVVPVRGDRAGLEGEHRDRRAVVVDGKLLRDLHRARRRGVAERRKEDPGDLARPESEPVQDQDVGVRVVEDPARGVPHERVAAPLVAPQRHQDRVDPVRLRALEDLPRHVGRRTDLGVDLHVERGRGLVGGNDQVHRVPPLPGHLGKGRRRDDVKDPDLAVRVEERRGEPDQRLDLRGLADRDEDLSVHALPPDVRQ